MAIWSLVPLDPSNPNWLASSHRGVALVRAPTEERARAAAAKAFDVKTGFRPGQGVPVPPWTRSALVRAERVEDPRFDAEGPDEVLEPAF
jgi:hypothetical protein